MQSLLTAEHPEHDAMLQTPADSLNFTTHVLTRRYFAVIITTATPTHDSVTSMVAEADLLPIATHERLLGLLAELEKTSPVETCLILDTKLGNITWYTANPDTFHIKVQHSKQDTEPWKLTFAVHDKARNSGTVHALELVGHQFEESLHFSGSRTTHAENRVERVEQIVQHVITAANAGKTSTSVWENTYESGQKAARASRHDVKDALRSWNIGQEKTDDTLLALSELVTNAEIHGHGAITVHVEKHKDHLRLEVSDKSVATPLKQTADVHNQRTSGRGLAIVEALSSNWGYITGGTKKIVWAILPLSS